MKRLILALLFLPLISTAQETDFRSLEQADSTMILNILKGIEETDAVSIAILRGYKPSKGVQRVFVWWRVGGIKEDWTRGVITIDRTVENVIGYSIDSNRKHPKYSQLNDSKYISSILKNI